MNRIDRFFQSGRKAFVPYITAGLPSNEATVEIMHLLVEEGADLIELGFPFSDPTADGPVIQAAGQQVLARGFRRSEYLDLIRRFRQRDERTPVLVFSYYNPIFRTGVDRFVSEVAAAGADGFVVTDLPLEEQGELLPVLRRAGLHLIQFVAPTTPEDRARRILADAGGFVYQIAVKGVTGARREVPEEALDQVRRTRQLTRLPVVLGFGVGTGEQARTVAQVADGVIVGSALVRLLLEPGDFRPALRQLVRELAAGVHGA